MAHGLDVIIRAAKKINDNSVKFFIIGDGAEKESDMGSAVHTSGHVYAVIFSVPPALLNFSPFPTKLSSTCKRRSQLQRTFGRGSSFNNSSIEI